MREVRLHVEFLAPCLGSIKSSADGRVVFRFARDPVTGRAMLRPGQWRDLVTFAARVLNGPVSLARRIEWDPTVRGEIGLWQRYIHNPARPKGRKAGYAQHEAFRSGAHASIDCVLPDAVTIAMLRRWLDKAAEYRGVSPFRPEHYGRFRVVDIDEEGPVEEEGPPG